MSAYASSSEGSYMSTSTRTGLNQELRHIHAVQSLIVDDATAAALRGEAQPNIRLRIHLERNGFFNAAPQELVVPSGPFNSAKASSDTERIYHGDWLAKVCEACRVFDAAASSSPDLEEAWVTTGQLEVQTKPTSQHTVAVLARKRGIRPDASIEAAGTAFCNVDPADILVVLQAKPSADSASYLDAEVARLTRLVNQHSPSRPSWTCIAFCKSSINLYRFTCSGFFKAEFQRAKAEPKPEAMLALVRWARKNYVDPLISEAVDGGSIKMEDGRLVSWIGKPRLVFARSTLIGSLTNVWRIQAPDRSTKVLKLAWVSAGMADRESEVYERVMEGATTGTDGFRTAIPSMCSDMSGIVAEDVAKDDLGGRRLVAVVLDGEPLEHYDERGKQGLVALLRGVRDAARVIFWLETVKKVHHRDVSSGNLRRQLAPPGGFNHDVLDKDWLLSPAEAGAQDGTHAPVLTSCLIDFGGAKRMDDTSESGKKRSGTWIFTSRAAHCSQMRRASPTEGEPVEAHRAWHDLESLVNVFHWLILALFVQDPAYRKERLADWDENVPGQGAQLWATALQYTQALAELEADLEAFDNIESAFIPNLLFAMRTLFDQSMAARGNACMTGRTAASGPSLKELSLRRTQELYASTPDIDEALFMEFVKSCNSAVKTLLESDTRGKSVQ